MQKKVGELVKVRPLRVFVDTSVIKLSVIARRVYHVKRRTVRWGGVEKTFDLHVPGYDYPFSRLNNPRMRRDAVAIFFLAEAAKRGWIEFVSSLEAMFELWGLPKVDSVTDHLFGANLRYLEEPILYERTLFDGGQRARDMQYEFLSSVTSPRFVELQKSTGAFQGKDRPLNRNQLLDAFHLWCSERNSSDYFLTSDYSLQRLVGCSKVQTTPIVTPEELLGHLISHVGVIRFLPFSLKGFWKFYFTLNKIREPWGFGGASDKRLSELRRRESLFAKFRKLI